MIHASMASNERNHWKTRKEIQFPPKAIKTKQEIIEKESEIAKEFNKTFH